MINILAFYIFIIGLILGSFFNVVGLRVPQNQSIITPRSFCSNCGHQLSIKELIPVLSFVIQGGKCTKCNKRISYLYPLVELFTAILFVIPIFINGWSSDLFIYWTLISLFMIIFVSDVTYMIIPDKVLIIFLIIFMMERFFIPYNPLLDSLIAAIISFILLLIMAYMSNGGMGGGDIKLFSLLGFVVGVKTILLTLFLSSMLGVIYGFFGLMFSFVEKGKPIPFGPFIIIAALFAYYFGDIILDYYFQLILG